MEGNKKIKFNSLGNIKYKDTNETPTSVNQTSIKRSTLRQ